MTTPPRAAGERRPIALVTGASRGIGRAAALRLAADGYDIAFCYAKDASAADEVSAAVGTAGGVATSAQVDVSSATMVQQWVADVERNLGTIEVAVANAGVVRDASALTMSQEAWNHVVDVNLTGCFNTCRTVAFHMAKRRRGSIVTLSSIAGVYGHAGQSNYAAAKAGIVGLTKSLAKELGRYGVRVNVVAPGFIDTDMIADVPERTRTDAARAVPLGGFGTAGDVADAISYLAGARYVTGAVLQVDGGLTI